MGKVNQLEITADVNNLAKIRDFVERSLVIPPDRQGIIADLVLAVDEAATNIILHGYKDKPGVIDIEISRKPDSISISLRDMAPSFDPTQVPPPDLSLPLEMRPPGHLGLHIIKHMVDELIYNIPPSGGNRLILIKKMPNEKPNRSIK